MARTGMTNIIEELRALTEAGTSEYTVGTTLYWSDNALQDMLDLNRQDLIFYQLTPTPVRALSGTLLYYQYRAPFQFFEETTGGTAVFYLQNSRGEVPGTSEYTVDYRRGIVNFGTTQRGTIYYVTGSVYDLNATAGDIWMQKASHYAPTSFNFSTDNHSIQREQVYSHCLDMKNFFYGMSGDAITVVQRDRGDI